MAAKSGDIDQQSELVARVRRESEARTRAYRERALKLYPWVCGRCGRQFTRRNLAELTVHHRDHKHDNNPEDGSNWELLCLYCHDNEHARQIEAAVMSPPTPGECTGPKGTFKPFADLRSRLSKNAK